MQLFCPFHKWERCSESSEELEVTPGADGEGRICRHVSYSDAKSR